MFRNARLADRNLLLTERPPFRSSYAFSLILLPAHSIRTPILLHLKVHRSAAITDRKPQKGESLDLERPMSWRLIVRGQRRSVLEMCVEYVWERGHVVYLNIEDRVQREGVFISDGTLTLECLLLACYHALVISEEAHFDRLLLYEHGVFAQMERLEHKWRKTLKTLFRQKLQQVSLLLADTSPGDLPPPWQWLVKMIPSFETWKGWPFQKARANAPDPTSQEGRLELLHFVVNRSKVFLEERKRAGRYTLLFMTSLKFAFAAESSVKLFIPTQEDEDVQLDEENYHAEELRYYRGRSSRVY